MSDEHRTSKELVTELCAVTMPGLVGLTRQAADVIERLEKELKALRLQYIADFGQLQDRAAHEPSAAPGKEQTTSEQVACQMCEALTMQLLEVGGEMGKVQESNNKLREALRRRESEPPDADRRDAERYRFLRKGNDYAHVGPMVVLCESSHIESDDRPFWVVAEAALDTHVDDARGAPTKPEGYETGSAGAAHKAAPGGGVPPGRTCPRCADGSECITHSRLAVETSAAPCEHMWVTSNFEPPRCLFCYVEKSESEEGSL